MSNSLLNNCRPCYTITLAECAENILVAAALEANRYYFYSIADKFGNKYQGRVLTDEAGSFSINTADIKPGIFMSFSGVFILQVFAEQLSCEAEKLSLCSKEYDCVSIQFEKIDTTEDLSTQNIPCGCEEITSA